MKRYICAMSTINPKFCNANGFQVEIEQRDEGPIPHVHVYWDPERNPEKCSYVRLDKAEYSNHHKDNKPMPRKIKDKFVKLMYSPWKNKTMVDNNGHIVYLTGYQEAVNIWVDTYEDDYSKFNLDDNGIPIMPDYSLL